MPIARVKYRRYREVTNVEFIFRFWNSAQRAINDSPNVMSTLMAMWRGETTKRKGLTGNLGLEWVGGSGPQAVFSVPLGVIPTRWRVLSLLCFVVSPYLVIGRVDTFCSPPRRHPLFATVRGRHTNYIPNPGRVCKPDGKWAPPDSGDPMPERAAPRRELPARLYVSDVRMGAIVLRLIYM